MLTGFDKRTEDMSKTLNTKITNNTAEINGLINEMRNMLSGMNSSLEKQRKELMT